MTNIPLSPVPNQEFSVAPSGNRYTINIRFFRSLMYVTVRNQYGAVYVGSLRCADRQWLLPYRQKNYGDGNFRFEDDNGQYPDYRNFGQSCRLVFYTVEELSSGEV